MEYWVWLLIGFLVSIIFILVVKIYLLQKASKEIKDAFVQILKKDTNILIDISSRDKYMCQLAACMNSELRELRKKRHLYENGDLELKDAITNISHDLRTPLTAICGYMELLEEEEKSEAVKRYLTIIDDRILVLKDLTEELFRYSIVTSTCNEVYYQEVVLNHVLEESISAYYVMLKEDKIIPNIYIPEEKIIRKLDKNALSRIFANIISNAIKYSDGDLNITLTQKGDIIFSNHASGLDEIQVGKLFNRFYTVESGKNSTGLGLSIAKILVEQMNGTITSKYQNQMISICVSFLED